MTFDYKRALATIALRSMPLAFAFLLCWGPVPIIFGQNHPNKIDFIGPDGLIYPNVSFAGVEGGIPTNLQVKATVSASSSDDRQAILNGINAAKAAGGGVVLLQNGVYDLSSSIDVTASNIVLRGQSRTGTIINLHQNSNNVDFGILRFQGGGRQSTRQQITQFSPRGSRRIFLSPQELTSFSRYYQPGRYLFVCEIIAPSEYQTKFKRSVVDGYYRELGKITSVGANYVDIEQPLRIDLVPILNSYVEPIEIIKYCGIENLHINGDSTLSPVNAVQFDWVVNSWVKDVDIIRPSSWPVGTYYAKHIEIRGSYFEKPYYREGGGVGYGGFTECYDCMWTETNTKSMRHAPNLTGHASGCVVKNSTFEESDLHWHQSWTRENVIENIVLLKGNHGFPYLMDTPMPDNNVHDPVGAMNVVYNSDFNGGVWGAGIKLGSFIEGWIFAHNRIHSPLRKAPPTQALIEIYDWAKDTYFLNNVFWTNNLDPNNRGIFAMFQPGYLPGFGQTGTWTFEGLNPEYEVSTPASTPIPSTAEVHFINNEIYGIASGREFVGLASPITDIGNNFHAQTNTAPPRPDAPVPSIYEWQKANRDTAVIGQSFPVSLAFLRAEPTQTDVQLLWETKLELTSSHFIIEKSIDQILFEEIGQTTATPNSENMFYTFDDMDVVPQAVYYYRLKMVGQDGEYKYSPTVEVVYNERTDFSAKILPNPTEGEVWLDLAYTGGKPLEASIYSLSGQKIETRELPLDNGRGKFRFDLKGQNTGLYFISIADPTKVVFHSTILKID